MTARILLLEKPCALFASMGRRVLPVQIEKQEQWDFPLLLIFFVEVNAHVHNFIIRPVLWL